MKIEDQVCTLGQAKRLKKFGVKQKSLWFWNTMYLEEERLSLFNASFKDQDFFIAGHSADNGIDISDFRKPYYSAFSVAELCLMLPYQSFNSGALHSDKDLKDGNVFFGFWKHGNQWSYRFKEVDADKFFDTQAECYADYLIHLLENNLITAQEINNRLN